MLLFNETGERGKPRPRRAKQPTTERVPRALGYVRVSTDEQAESGLGLDAQREAIRRAAEADAGNVRRVRFLTSHPKDLSPRLIDAMADCGRIAKHLHLPVQSGSDRVLHVMNRHYTVDKYRRQVDALRRKVDGIGLSTDLIVGFPGETDADFEATLELVRDIEYDAFFSFEYSPRPGTAATRYEDDVPAALKRERLLRLQALGADIQRRHNEAWVGKRTDVLIDGFSKKTERDVTGRTSSTTTSRSPYRTRTGRSPVRQPFATCLDRRPGPWSWTSTVCSRWIR